MPRIRAGSSGRQDCLLFWQRPDRNRGLCLRQLSAGNLCSASPIVMHIIVQLLRLLAIVGFGRAFEGSGIEGSGVEGSGAAEGSGWLSEGSGLPEEGSGSAVGLSRDATTEETLTHDDVEILRSIKLAEIARRMSPPMLGHAKVMTAMEDKIETDLADGSSWKELEGLLLEVVKNQLEVVTPASKREAFPNPNNLKIGKPACSARSACFNDKECGYKGKCMGARVGRCNCNACLEDVVCSDDSACGGLQGACLNGVCQCSEALTRHHGGEFFVEVLTSFCSSSSCTSSDECFGLPCQQGTCDCL